MRHPRKIAYGVYPYELVRMPRCELVRRGKPYPDLGGSRTPIGCRIERRRGNITHNIRHP